MSIIYSYPLKNENAQPDDLLVISDSADKNRTKQIKISQLPSGGGGGGSVLLTTSGTTGQATLVGETLNIPVYQGQLTITTTGSGASVLTGDTLNIPINSYILDLATSDARGGLKIGYTQNSQNYPLQLGTTGADAEKGFVNVPWVNTTYDIASSTQAGIVELGSDTVLTSTFVAGQPGEENRVFPVQINGDKQMGVFVPTSGGSSYVLPPATNTALGGIKAEKITQDVPQPASEGDYYPVQILDSDSDAEDFCVVRVPNSGSTSQPKIGFSPMSIYEARNVVTKTTNGKTYWTQYVISNDTTINQVDFWSLNGNITGNVTIGVYTGVLNTTTASSATLAAYGTAGAISVGVNKVALTTGGTPASFSPGQAVVVMVSLNGGQAPSVLGIPGSQYPLSQAKLAMKADGFLLSNDLAIGDTITANLTTLLNAGTQDEAELNLVDRFALHFYETNKSDGESSGSGDTDDSDDSDDGNTGSGDTGSGDGDTADEEKAPDDGSSGDTGSGDEDTTNEDGEDGQDG